MSIINNGSLICEHCDSDECVEYSRLFEDWYCHGCRMSDIKCLEGDELFKRALKQYGYPYFSSKDTFIIMGIPAKIAEGFLQNCGLEGVITTDGQDCRVVLTA